MVEPRPYETTFVQGVVTAVGFAVCTGWRFGLEMFAAFSVWAFAIYRVEPGCRR